MKHAKPGMHSDGGGLYLQVTEGKPRQGNATINKSWVFRFRYAGRKREMGLGSLPTIGLGEARERARHCCEMLLDGTDPIAARNGTRAVEVAEKAPAQTFQACGIKYMATHEAGWRNAKHRNGEHIMPAPTLFQILAMAPRWLALLSRMKISRLRLRLLRWLEIEGGWGTVLLIAAAGMVAILALGIALAQKT